MPDIEPPTLEFASDDTLTGFRLKRLEVLNWGTFHERVWQLEPDGRNLLLTGDIGSGKSTLVDAVTTLLVPAHRIAYNKAAGAEFKERNLRSYVLGYHRTGRSESGIGTAKPIGLRDANTYSVLLAVFHNSGYDQTITLACVLWMKDPNGQPARFYVGADKALSIVEDFSGFNSDFVALRRRLRKDGGKTFEAFPEYSAWFRRRFGIESEQALDLFHQTVSMKSVGNLTDFVRDHMLEPSEMEPRIEALIGHFTDLDRAHASVLRAKRQLELLTPITADCRRHADLENELARQITFRDLLQPYFATRKLALLTTRHETLQADLERQSQRKAAIAETLGKLQEESAALALQISRNGGDRIHSLETNLQELGKERDGRQRRAGYYKAHLSHLDECPAESEDAFLEQKQRLKKQKEHQQTLLADLENRLTELEVALAQLKDKTTGLEKEIISLRARKSNIPDFQIRIRQALCHDLGFSPDTLPFAGELLQVRPEEQAWEGAAEKLLRSFGLSLLVPDVHYADVARWVDDTRMKGKIVYYRVRASLPQRGPAALHPDSMARKLSILPDSPFYPWLERELQHRFDLACCTSQEAFRRENKAITRNGQIKRPGDHHEKDNRYAINDRSQYVLGWSNESKIAALEQELEAHRKKGGEQVASRNALLEQHKEITRVLDALKALVEYREYREIDWTSPAREIARLEAELAALRAASDILAQLTLRQQQITGEIAEQTARQEKINEDYGAIKHRITDNDELLEVTRESLVGIDQPMLEEHTGALDLLLQRALADATLNVQNCDARERDVRHWLQAEIDALTKRKERLIERITAAMRDFCHEFEMETREFDATIASAAEFRMLQEKLESDDLPRFEKSFKELLNQNTIREIANFNAHLNQQQETIRERVGRINQSLTAIDYNPGRYIRLEADPALDHDLQAFKKELRACTEGALSGSEDEQYSEAKFLQVKSIIERFRGREGLTDLDRRWTRKVTDVRNWFTFAATERWREDDKEHEHYSDSSGKSGGQKEKLAYTILAASLAYQFGLEWGKVRSRSFRFVVIDEAFGRGSDESAQYGLRLFEQLNLQLLIVTPLQKIDVIEPFVASVGYVHNEEGRESRLRHMSIETYRHEKKQQQEATA